MTTVAHPTPEPGVSAPAQVADDGPGGWLRHWAPAITAAVIVVAVLLAAGTSVVDIARYAAYLGLAVIAPGTLVYRALRRRPHTLVEDLAMGAAVGLVLELAAWAGFAALGGQRWLWLWPAVGYAVFAGVPGLRRHWLVRGYRPVPLGWSWCVAAVVVFFTVYLGEVFLYRNPILPTSEGTRQYLDLAYQLSLAGEAKHHFPIHLPQVAEEPLHYHWFGYAHMAATSLIGHIDLPVVALRLAIPALCIGAIVLTAVAGWRISGRPYVGAGAAMLFFVIGEVNFTHFVTQPFGTQAAFVIWHGMSMIYSWVLLIALIPVLAELVGGGRVSSSHAPRRLDGSPSLVAALLGPDDAAPFRSLRGAARRVPPIGAGGYGLAALFLLASSGAKASSVPVVALALALTAVVQLVQRRRIPWPVVAVGALAAAAQLFATAVLYAFQTYGLTIGPFAGIRAFAQQESGQSTLERWVILAAVFLAFLVNMQSRVAGVLPLLWWRRTRLQPAQWFLLGGTLAGPTLYLTFNQPGGANQYFTRAGFTFGVLLSAWGLAIALDRARLSRRARLVLCLGVAGFAVALVLIQLRYAAPQPSGHPYSPVLPILGWSFALVVFGLCAAAMWMLARMRWPALRGRGSVVVLSAVLAAGAPGLVMDMYKSAQVPNGGAYFNITLPASRVTAARWVRDHSAPDDVVATNVHCLVSYQGGWCDSRSFWLSAYAERRVLIEGWQFAPRVVNQWLSPFWDQKLLALNDAAFTAPTPDGLRALHEQHRVRFLVVDRAVSPESSALATLAKRRFDNGRLAVYELP